LQAQQAFQVAYPQLAEQHSQLLAAALNNAAGTAATSAAGTTTDANNSYSSTSKLSDTAAAATALAQLEQALAAAGSSAGAAAAGGVATTASQVGLSGAAGSAGADGSAAAGAAGPVQALLQLAATAGSDLEAVDKVCIDMVFVCCCLSHMRLVCSGGKCGDVWHGCAGDCSWLVGCIVCLSDYGYLLQLQATHSVPNLLPSV
jgi:hypothetical protein